MAPKKVAAETITSPNRAPETEEKENHITDSPEEGNKAVKKVPAHPSTMEMVKEALMEQDQRKGVSAQAIRTFIKEKYPTVGEARLKTMVRKALAKGIESGAIVRPANSATTTGAQGRFRLAVRKLTKSKEAKENTNPNIDKAKEAKAKTKDAKTKKTKSATVEGGEPKKTKKNDASASKVAPAKKPKAKRAAGATDEGAPESKTQKTSKASKDEKGEKPGAKKGGKKAAQKAEEGPDEGADVSLQKKEAQKSEDGGKETEASTQKKGGKKVAQKADGGETSKSSAKRGKKAAEK